MDASMNILFIAHYVDLYGANRSLLNLLKGLKQTYGLSCHVAVPRTGALTHELTKLGVEFIILDIPWWFLKEHEIVQDGPLHKGRLRTTLRWIRREIRAVLRLRRVIRERKIELVHTNSVIVLTGLILSWVTAKPHVWHLREYATLDYNLKPIIGNAGTSWLVHRSTATISVSKSIASHFKVIGKRNARVVYNGVLDLKDVATLARTNEKALGSFAFCIVGVISRAKGHDEAIRALASVVKRYPGTILRIVGEGAVNDMIQLANELGIGNHVRFDGYVDDIFPILQEVDSLLMCSRNEAMGRVTAEAMSAGLPVIGRNSGGTAELIVHGDDGLLYDNGYTELAEQMIKLMSDKELYRRISLNALRKARANFTNESYVEQVRSLYIHLLRR